MFYSFSSFLVTARTYFFLSFLSMAFMSRLYVVFVSSFYFFSGWGVGRSCIGSVVGTFIISFVSLDFARKCIFYDVFCVVMFGI